MDIHAHFVPEGYLRLIESDGKPHGASLRPGPEGPSIVIGEVAIGPITPAYHDLGRRLKAMDAQGVTVHALSLMPPMVYWADADLGRRLARLVNDAYFDTITHSPGALRYLIGLVGADRVMLGSDYCFDMGYEDPVGMLATVPSLGRRERAQILGGNARRLLGLG